MEQSNFNFEGFSEEDIRSAKASEYNGRINKLHNTLEEDDLWDILWSMENEFRR